MGRVAVKLDAGNELSLKASTLEIACKLCCAVFGEGNLILRPTCEYVWMCAACKFQHRWVDQSGTVGVTLGNSQGRLTIQDVVANSPAAEVSILRKWNDTVCAMLCKLTSEGESRRAST